MDGEVDSDDDDLDKKPKAKESLAKLSSIHKEFTNKRAAHSTGASPGKKKLKSSPRKPRTKAPVEDVSANPKAYIGRHIAKYFDDELYYGTVKTYFPASEMDSGVEAWYIEFDDGDTEDFSAQELKAGLAQVHWNPRPPSTEQINA